MLDYIADRLEAIAEGRDAERVGPTEAARLLGYPRGHLSPSAHPERIPYLGARGTLHPVRTWRTWNEVPDGARLRQWDALTLKQRRAILGFGAERREA
jgi:hypothetical protein